MNEATFWATALVVFGTTHVILGWFAPHLLRAYPGSDSTRRSFGLGVGAVMLVGGAILLLV